MRGDKLEMGKNEGREEIPHTRKVAWEKGDTSSMYPVKVSFRGVGGTMNFFLSINVMNVHGTRTGFHGRSKAKKMF